MWIGGKQENGSWAWGDGSPWGFESWATGQPSSDGANIFLQTEIKMWSSFPASAEAGYICQNLGEILRY